jgi:hypothetical protein
MAAVEVQPNLTEVLGQTILLTKYTVISVLLVHGPSPTSIVTHLMAF